MKACKMCGVEKPLTEFYQNRLARGGYDARCKPCKIEAAKQRKRQWKIDAIAMKGGKCEMCGGEFPPCVYDFHHHSDDKEISPGDADGKEAFFREVDKCQLLCSNCHRIVHHV